jgi:hypothetical protein
VSMASQQNELRKSNQTTLSRASSWYISDSSRQGRTTINIKYFLTLTSSRTLEQPCSRYTAVVLVLFLPATDTGNIIHHI